MSRLREWVRRRRRAVCLGDMGHARLWCDPETERIWQAAHRWSLFTVPSNEDTVETAVRMLDTVHLCELHVDRDDPLGRDS